MTYFVSVAFKYEKGTIPAPSLDLYTYYPQAKLAIFQ